LARYGGDINDAWTAYCTFYYSQLCPGQDRRTTETIHNLLELAYSFFALQRRTLIELPKICIHDQAAWNKEFPQIREEFKFTEISKFSGFGPEIWFHHHGLRFLSQRIKNYIRDRDILDIGASVGDSLIALDRYTDRRIFSYELMPSTTETTRYVASKLHPHKHVVFNMGISNTSYITAVSTRGGVSSNLQSHGSVPVSVTTIDKEAERLNFTVGFIKADAEGEEPQIILGALKTIKRDRPVISMAIYHSDELLYVPLLLTSLNYELRYFFGSSDRDHRKFSETTVVGIPRELETVCRVQNVVPDIRSPYSINKTKG
jgi:FkbM family methyltransferase